MKRDYAEDLFNSIEPIVFSPVFLRMHKTVHIAIIKDSYDKDENGKFELDDDYKIEIAFEKLPVFQIGLQSFSDNVIQEINKSLDTKTVSNDETEFTESTRPALQNDDYYKHYNPYKLRDKNPSGGTSVINNQLHKDFSGSLGLAFKLKNHTGSYFLSNFHVLARRKELNVKRYETIIHPSKSDTYDNNTSDLNPIATLFWFNLDEYVDAAIAKSNCEKSIGSGIRCLPNLKIEGVDSPEIGQNVMKCGRSTNLTHGVIRSDRCTVLIKDKYKLVSKTGSRIFKDQILTKCMSLAGDSGSVLLKSAKNGHSTSALGLLFAGDSENYSYHNKLNNIFYRLIGDSEYLIMPKLDFDNFL
ncbi:hypothetical protein [uncultured Psychroserpens sp.]|uniref:hypothetical protein n=1 Tax=uncultured Psychroserpens sp. TaxID=255436 RepID=UPI002605B9C4|nr:hypothetical protein [uncultured Psychroserpens sp.]